MKYAIAILAVVIVGMIVVGGLFALGAGELMSGWIGGVLMTAVGFYYTRDEEPKNNKRMKVLKLNGFKYSTLSFKDYKFRAQVTIGTVGEAVKLDIYTTDPDKEHVQRVLENRRTEKATSVTVTYWCTREQDDAAAEMIDEWLNEDK